MGQGQTKQYESKHTHTHTKYIVCVWALSTHISYLVFFGQLETWTYFCYINCLTHTTIICCSTSLNSKFSSLLQRCSSVSLQGSDHGGPRINVKLWAEHLPCFTQTLNPPSTRLHVLIAFSSHQSHNSVGGLRSEDQPLQDFLGTAVLRNASFAAYNPKCCV